MHSVVFSLLFCLSREKTYPSGEKIRNRASTFSQRSRFTTQNLISPNFNSELFALD